MEVRFVVLSPSNANRVVPVRLPILVGRGDEAKFRIQKDSVSRRHCEFFIESDVVHVRDLGSTNGTLLDKEPIPVSVATAVPPGTVVNVGGVAFRVEYDSSSAPPMDKADDNDTLPLAVDQAVEAADPAAASVAPDEAAVDAPQAGPATAFAGLPVADEPAAEGFGFLPDADADASPAADDDDNLNDFFKSLT